MESLSLFSFDAVYKWDLNGDQRISQSISKNNPKCFASFKNEPLIFFNTEANNFICIELFVVLCYKYKKLNNNLMESTMSFSHQKTIDFLLEYACPSIKYLVYRDMLNTSVDEPFMVALQNEVLTQTNTQKHLSAQQSDGWFGHELHGIDGMDCHISGLLNLGVEASNPAIQKAVTALLTPEIASAHKNWFRGGAALDAEGRGGDRAIVANILAMAQAPEEILVYAEELSLAFDHLSAVLKYKSVDDFSIRGKNERYYKPKAKFPGSNHMGILAAAQAWRTEENMKTAKAAVKHAYEIMYE